MLIIPAIDLKDGCVVRFTQGRLNKKVYSRDPLRTAKHWVKQGAGFLHIVDLDGAFTGIPKNLDIVKKIARSVDVPMQFGGGIRDIEMIKKILSFGIGRIILGTQAIRENRFLIKVIKLFKEKVIVSLDAREQNVLIRGWQVTSRGRGLFDFAPHLKKMGFKELIYTDTLRDGTLSGPNIKGIKNLLRASGMKIIASGGVSSLDDIYRLKLLEKQGLIGIIIGKALYEGRFTLPQALKLA